MSSRERFEPASLAVALHWASLVGAAAFLLWVNRHQWFFVDDFAFVADRGLIGTHDQGLWEPHNEHWSTIPVLVYRALYMLFGVRTYLPYLLVLIGAHLLLVHLMWRLFRRIGIDPFIATAAAGLFAVLGAGWENLTWAFAFSTVASLAAGFGALLVMPARRSFGRRDAAVWALTIVGLMCSGVGGAMLGVVGLTALLRRGARAAVVIVSVPAAVYVTWYLVYGSEAPRLTFREPFSTAVQKIPAFAWSGLTGAVDAATGLSGIGVVVVLGLGVWLVRASRPREESWVLALSTAFGALLFLALITLSRSGLGVEFAATSRYAYVVIALLLPATAFAVDALLRGSRVRLAAVAGLTAALLVVQLSELNRMADDYAVIEQEQKHRILAAAELLDEGAEIIEKLPSPDYAPNLSADELAEIDREGKLPGNVGVSEEDRLTARVYLQVSLGPDPAVAETTARPAFVRAVGAEVRTGPPECVQLAPASDAPSALLRFELPGNVSIEATRQGRLTVTLERTGGALGRARAFAMQGGIAQVMSVAADDVVVRLELPPDGTTTVCGLAPAPFAPESGAAI